MPCPNPCNIPPNVLDVIGWEYANAPAAEQLKHIDAAIKRVSISQETDVQGNKNQRALLRDLWEVRKGLFELAYYAANPSGPIMGTFFRG